MGTPHNPDLTSHWLVWRTDATHNKQRRPHPTLNPDTPCEAQCDPPEGLLPAAVKLLVVDDLSHPHLRRTSAATRTRQPECRSKVATVARPNFACRHNVRTPAARITSYSRPQETKHAATCTQQPERRGKVAAVACPDLSCRQHAHAAGIKRVLHTNCHPPHARSWCTPPPPGSMNPRVMLSLLTCPPVVDHSQHTHHQLGPKCKASNLYIHVYSCSWLSSNQTCSWLPPLREWFKFMAHLQETSGPPPSADPCNMLPALAKTLIIMITPSCMFMAPAPSVHVHGSPARDQWSATPSRFL
jgi:hypothetical protein